MPVSRFGDDLWIVPPRLPLNDAFRGVCRAGEPSNGDAFEPLEKLQRELCNCGYARGWCERFPADSAADAVRFSILDDADGIVRLVYVLEREYAPVEHGIVEYSIPESRPISDPSELLAAQARAFLEAYIRNRKPQAEACAT